MEKEEYEKIIKTTDPIDVKKALDTISQATPEQREAMLRGITESYLKKIGSEIDFWISMYDYCNHIRYIDMDKKHKKIFLTTNNDFIDFMKLLNKKQDHLLILSIEDMSKVVKDIKKDGKVKI